MNEKDRDVINYLLSKEELVSSQFHNVVGEIMKHGYNTERGKDEIDMLIKCVRRVMKDIEFKYIK